MRIPGVSWKPAWRWTGAKTPMFPGDPSLVSLIKSGQLGRALICYPVFAYRLRRFLIVMVLYKNYKKFGGAYCRALLKEYFRSKIGKSAKFRDNFSYKSLRRIVERDIGTLASDNEALAPLRRGR